MWLCVLPAVIVGIVYAVGIAALLNGRVHGRAIGVVISGGNVGAQRFAELVRGR